MQLPDIRTLVLVANIVALTMAGVLALAAIVQGRTNRPLALWATAFLSKALGLLLIYLRSSIPDILSYSLGNALVVISAQLIFIGTAEFLGRRIRWRLQAGFTAATLLGIPTLFATTPYFATVSMMIGGLILFDLAAIRILIHRPARGMRTVQALVAAVLALEVLFLASRVAWLLWTMPGAALFAPSLVTVVFYVNVTLVTMLLATGLLVMLYRRAQLAERERVEELQAALAAVKRLEGMLPICAWCKRIRDDHDGWHPVETYLASRTEASFSHSICPECATRVEKTLPSNSRTTRSVP